MSTASMTSIESIWAMVQQHENYRARCLNLIASENVVSASSRQLMTSDLVGRYATYGDDPTKRNYRGNKHIAEIETAALRLARDLFNAEFVDLRPLSGEMAVKAIFTGLTVPGDRVLETGPTDGGHGVGRRMLTCGLFGGVLHLEYLPVEDYQLDLDIPRLRQMIYEQKPRLIVFGRSRILFPEPIDQIRQAASDVGALIGYDASHIMGLIAGKVFPNPLDQGADVVAGSTAKTLGAPQGGIIFTRNKEIHGRIRAGFYPTLVANHHINRIPGIACTLLEMSRYGNEYCRQIVRNSQALGRSLTEFGLIALGPERNFSQSHQVLVDVSSIGDAGVIADHLEQANIILDAVSLPRDIKADGKTKSGLRIGTQEITRTGAIERDMKDIADLICQVVLHGQDPPSLAPNVASIAARFSEIKYTFDRGQQPYAVERRS